MEEGRTELSPGPVALIAARNEAESLAATVSALREVFPDVRVWVADDASEDGTVKVAEGSGAEVVTRKRPLGKGGNVTACARVAIERGAFGDSDGTVLLLDADLGETALQLSRLRDAIASGECDLAVGAFSRKVGGGFGVALGFARWAIRNRCGFEAEAPISGQRAMRRETLDRLLPFADGWGMEVGMTIDAVRAGFTVREYEVDLAHRATGRNLSGFTHRFAQLAGFIRTWWARR